MKGIFLTLLFISAIAFSGNAPDGSAAHWIWPQGVGIKGVEQEDEDSKYIIFSVEPGTWNFEAK